ncbi:MAG: hypothetical protein K6G16_02360 [Lachnospiraceae bacterium]|nr:hypothetical protein [Lachnospiraceae bacterium]
MLKLDEKIRALFGRYMREIIVAVLFALSVIIRLELAPKTSWSGDYLYCIAPWVEEYRKLGFVKGLASEITNYYIPYNIIFALSALCPTEAWVPISIISCAAEYLMIYYAFRILTYLGGEKATFPAAFAVLLLLYLPPVILNGAFWKQCDAIYAAFGMMSLYYLLTEKYYRAFLFLSIAFVFKLQIILLFPVFLIAYFCGKNYSILLWLRIPVTYLEAGLPAILCGRPPAEVYAIYLNQSDEYHYMFMNTGNLYRLLRSDYEALSHAAILATVAFLAFLFYYVYRRREAVTDRMLLMLAGLTGYACFLFLPAMHERYDYLPIILVTLYYAYYDKKKLYIPAVMVLVTSVMYCAYLFGGNTLPEEMYALMSLCAFALMVKDTANMLNKNREGVRHVHQDQ